MEVGAVCELVKFLSYQKEHEKKEKKRKEEKMRGRLALQKEIDEVKRDLEKVTTMWLQLQEEESHQKKSGLVLRGKMKWPVRSLVKRDRRHRKDALRKKEELPNEQQEEVKEVLIVENKKEEKVPEQALKEGKENERKVLRKGALMETLWSLVFISKLVFMFAGMKNLLMQVKLKSLRNMKDGVSQAPMKRNEQDSCKDQLEEGYEKNEDFHDDKGSMTENMEYYDALDSIPSEEEVQEESKARQEAIKEDIGKLKAIEQVSMRTEYDDQIYESDVSDIKEDLEQDNDKRLTQEDVCDHAMPRRLKEIENEDKSAGHQKYMLPKEIKHSYVMPKWLEKTKDKEEKVESKKETIKLELSHEEPRQGMEENSVYKIKSVQYAGAQESRNEYKHSLTHEWRRKHEKQMVYQPKVIQNKVWQAKSFKEQQYKVIKHEVMESGRSSKDGEARAEYSQGSQSSEKDEDKTGPIYDEDEREVDGADLEEEMKILEELMKRMTAKTERNQEIERRRRRTVEKKEREEVLPRIEQHEKLQEMKQLRKEELEKEEADQERERMKMTKLKMVNEKTKRNGEEEHSVDIQEASWPQPFTSNGVVNIVNAGLADKEMNQVYDSMRKFMRQEEQEDIEDTCDDEVEAFEGEEAPKYDFEYKSMEQLQEELKALEEVIYQAKEDHADRHEDHTSEEVVEDNQISVEEAYEPSKQVEEVDFSIQYFHFSLKVKQAYKEAKNEREKELLKKQVEAINSCENISLAMTKEL
ncbi:hypothetical protein KI387_040367 [Taxus chinensis]|uniref:Uncharacterized protein n=1 Tax=Taxus chinensis TaxID=29808 RepID=A0AA38FAA7_TAXCH|nr:hypothetical protein KI387_040367 [Taxus chinensis]